MRISVSFTSAFNCRSTNCSGVCTFDLLFPNGWVTERSIVHAWKACVPKGTRGSNPRPSAIRPIEQRKTNAKRFGSAGEGNRTLVSSLEGYSSTIKLHPRADSTDPVTKKIARNVLTLLLWGRDKENRNCS